MEEGDAWVRAEARRVVEVIGGHSIPLLMRMIRSDDQNASVAAVGAQAAERDVQLLIKALGRARTRGDAGTMLDVLAKIEELGVAAKEAVPLLKELVLDPHPDVRFQAVMTWQKVDDFSYGELCIDRCRNWRDSWRRHWQPIKEPGAGRKVSKEAPPGETWKAWTDSMERMLQSLPSSYDDLTQALAAASHTFRKSLANRLEKALNDELQKKQHGTLEEKKELARWVNDQLEPFGPGKLRGVRGSEPGVGCFQIEVKIDGKQEVPTVSDSLPTLQLMDADPPEEVRSHFRELVKKKLNPKFHAR